MHKLDTATLLSAALLVACSPVAKNVGALDAGDTEGDDGSADAAEATAGNDGPGGSGAVDGDESGGGDPGAVPACAEDVDRDQIAIGEDNAPVTFNPDQTDRDGDALADVDDMCALVAGAALADSDRDGLGNECDPCRHVVDQYQVDDVPDYMRVRNVPGVLDSDGDGIGDACDRCVRAPDCGGFGPANPWRPSDGDPLVDATCQADADDDGIGDACDGVQAPDAAGPVGLGPADDFDQDGLRNDEDGCPRHPVETSIACGTDEDCGVARRCESTGVCDHLDADGDDIGDVCDTCPSVANPNQNVEGFAQEDDADGDFIGRDCELGVEFGCGELKNAPGVGFYPVSADGWCCVVAWDDRAIVDPWGVPVDPECTDAQAAAGDCVAPPIASLHAPGQFTLPLGCQLALAEAGIPASQNRPLMPDDVGGLDELWPYACRMPVQDQDFDGIADVCDLCPHAFHPSNEPYVDDAGTLWPLDGKYCNGAWAPQSCG